jgi:hypothetical protein
MEERFDQLVHVHHCGRSVLKSRPEETVLLEVNVRTNSAKTSDPSWFASSCDFDYATIYSSPLLFHRRRIQVGFLLGSRLILDITD